MGTILAAELLHPLIRIAAAHFTQNFVGKRNLAMSPGTNPEIIPEAPVIQIMSTNSPRLCISRDLITLPTRCNNLFLDNRFQRIHGCFVRKLWWIFGEDGLRLKR